MIRNFCSLLPMSTYNVAVRRFRAAFSLKFEDTLIRGPKLSGQYTKIFRPGLGQ